MKVWVITKNGIPDDVVYTALKDACARAGVGYMSAVKGKRLFTQGDDSIRLTQTEVVRCAKGNRTGNVGNLS